MKSKRKAQELIDLAAKARGNGKADADAQFRREAVIVPMSSIEAREIGWLWQYRMALGRISVLAGQGGIGKSYVMTDLAARLSTGDVMPDGSLAERCEILFISGEDDPGDTIRPRLDAHGADVSRIHLLRSVRRFSLDQKQKSSEVIFTLEDVEVLEDALRRYPGVRLVVVDPIGSFIGARVDSNTDNQVRGVLAPVAKMAEQHNVAVLCVAHHKKGGGQIADELILGSRAFSALARSCWHVFVDPEDEERRLLLQGKNNIARRQHGMGFHIVGEPVGSIVWEQDLVPMSADQFLREMGKPGPEPEQQREAAAFLREALKDGALASKDLKKQASEAGIAWRTLERAKTLAKVKVERCPHSKQWQWRLLKNKTTTTTTTSSSSSLPSTQPGGPGGLGEPDGPGGPGGANVPAPGAGVVTPPTPPSPPTPPRSPGSLGLGGVIPAGRKGST